MTYRITIPGNTISLKNSKQIVLTGNGKRRIIASRAYRTWAEMALWHLKSCPLVGKQWRYPLRVSFTFYRDSQRRWDWINLQQGPLDLLRQAGIIEDDDMNHVIPYPDTWHIDKDNPRVVMTIEELGR